MRRALGLTVLIATLAAAATPAAASMPLIDCASRSDGPQFENQPCAPSGINPRDAFSRGVVALRAKHYRGAATLLGVVVDAAPRHIQAWRLLGVAYAGQGRWHASRRAFERALRIAPNDALSHAGRGEALLALKDARAGEEAAWLKMRAQACAGACVDAAILHALGTRGPFAAPAA